MLIRKATSLAVLVAVGAACGGSDADIAATGPTSPESSVAVVDGSPVVTDPVVTDPVVTDPVVTDPVATDPVDSGPPRTDPVDSGPVGTDPEREPGALLDPSTLDVVSVVDQLNRLPLSAAHAELADNGTVVIESSDLLAAAAMQGLAPASAIDGGFDVFLAVADPSSVERGGSGLGTMRLSWPDLLNGGQIDEASPEFGFTALDVDAFVSIASYTPQITVVSGNLTPSNDLVDLGNGVLSAGEGEDFANALENRTSARPLGRPHRVATRDGLVAITLSTPLIEEWLAGGPTLATEPAVLAAAEALDRAHVVSSIIQWGDLTVSDELLGSIEGADLLQVPFDAVGIGATAIDGAPATVVAYVFDDETAADSAVSEIESMWRDGTLFMRRVGLDEMFDVVSVERIDNTVVVTTLVDDESTTFAAFQMLYQGEPLFAHA